jgi:hypothetical protein
MLFHHDNREYDVAAKQARDQAEQKLQKLIEQGKQNCTPVLQQIFQQVPYDRLRSARDLNFVATEQGVDVLADALRDSEGRVVLDQEGLAVDPGFQESLHPHAMRQICEKGQLPKSYADRLIEKGDWGRRLLAQNFRELYQHDDSIYLMRRMEGQIRGFLSNSFKRMDSRPIVEAFIGSCNKVGALPIQGYQMDVRIGLKAIVGELFEPAPNEIMAFGISLLNSDFGAGALALKPFCMRLWCTNYAIMEQSLRAVHLGQKLTQDDMQSLSQRTLTLQGQTAESAVQDVVEGCLSKQRIQQYCSIVREASSHQIDFKQELDKLRKKGLLKGEADAVESIYQNGTFQQIPQGNSQWKLSNAVSWLANQTPDTSRKVELMEMAGSCLPSLGNQ